MRWWRNGCLAALALVGVPAAGEMIADAPLLEAMDVADWPVVDGRELAERSQEPIPRALAFDRELLLDAPHVLVVAGDDDAAQTLARVVEARFPAISAVAVAGGAATLRIVRRTAAAAFADGMPRNFIIPSDTCQVGNPLHVYRGGEEPGSASPGQ